ncbi:MAG: hypothetical protein Q7T80_12415 [Methanoregula sp.]|nr:hypothetical protein [Methanoregula sp.]
MKTDSAGNAAILVRATWASGTHFYPVPLRYPSLIVRTLVLVLVSFSVMGGGALAHSPADVVLSFDQNTGDIIVIITHQVDDPTTHFVKQVTVTQGDVILADKSYTSQPDRSSFTYRYQLPQLKGSSGDIRVDAPCSQFGSRSGSLTLPATPGAAASGNAIPAGTTPAKSPVFACAALVAVGFVAARILR